MKKNFALIPMSIMLIGNIILLIVSKDSIGGGILLWWIGLPWDIILEWSINKITYTDRISSYYQNYIGFTGGIINVLIFSFIISKFIKK